MFGPPGSFGSSGGGQKSSGFFAPPPPMYGEQWHRAKVNSEKLELESKKSSMDPDEYEALEDDILISGALVNFGASPSLVRARLITTPHQDDYSQIEASDRSQLEGYTGRSSSHEVHTNQSSSHGRIVASWTNGQKTFIALLAIVAFGLVDIALAIIVYNEVLFLMTGP